MTREPHLRWGWIECFVLLLFLLNGLLLLPGTQPFRFAIRAAPYAASLASLFLAGRKRLPFPPGALAVTLALVLLALNLLHPRTQFAAGLAQLAFQAAIAAPLFWAAGFADSGRRLMRLLWILFACNALGSLAGILQIYFPDTFLPASFSAGASESWLRSLTFLSPSSRILVRPPGLSDLPGGAAIAGSLTAILGLAFSSLRATRIWVRFVSFTAAVAGISVLYLTQVRSLALLTLLALALLTFFGIRQPHLWNRGWMAGAAVFLVLGSFCWAVAVGGDKVRQRFLNMGDEGVMATYDDSRGWSWRYTFGEGMLEYPLGAGLGRWGMMNAYFGAERPESPALWAEIQPQGWLYDGGAPLWLLYGSALAASLLFTWRVAGSTRYGPLVPLAAALIFCVNTVIAGSGLTGPAFNTTLGLEYWLLLALLYGAARLSWQFKARAA
jgi:hypothetical protein